MDRILESLGNYIGEYIIPQLPVLSCDNINSKYQITYGESLELKALTEKNLKVKENWDNYQILRKKLKTKYLPKEITIFLLPIPLEDLDIVKLKEYIKSSLYHSDICEYNLDNFKLENEKHKSFTSTQITLYLDKP